MRRLDADADDRRQVVGARQHAHVDEQAVARPRLPLVAPLTVEQMAAALLSILEVGILDELAAAGRLHLVERARAAEGEEVGVLGERRRRVAALHQVGELRVGLVRRDDEGHAARARISAIVAWTIADDTDACSCARLALAPLRAPCARRLAVLAARLAAPAVLPPSPAARRRRRRERPHAVLGEEAEHPQREREVRRRRLAAHQLARARARRGGATTASATVRPR